MSVVTSNAVQKRLLEETIKGNSYHFDPQGGLLFNSTTTAAYIPAPPLLPYKSSELLDQSFSVSFDIKLQSPGPGIILQTLTRANPQDGISIKILILIICLLN